MFLDNHFSDQISADIIQTTEGESSIRYGEYNYFNGEMFKQNNTAQRKWIQEVNLKFGVPLSSL